ncbi:2,3-bisphosphoglycerate-dependent phosphoglycerate mutase [Nocardia takedensis]
MLALVRHGESVWNAEDRFAGRIDVALTGRGREQAREAGRRLLSQGVVPTVVHTSLLSRARNTGDLITDACAASSVPVLRTHRLNERHYGLLQGLRRSDAVRRYGAVRVAGWRRGIADRPPPDAFGRGESLTDVRERVTPYLHEEVMPALDAGHTLLVVSHGNTLRMLVQLIEGLDDDAATALDIPTGAARIYDPGSVAPPVEGNGLIADRG